MGGTEADWIRQAMQGDDDAFTLLVESYQRPVYNLCYRMLGDPQEAEDAAQESFWRAYQALRRYDPQRSFLTWLLSIAAHHCIDLQRRRRLPLVSMDVLPEEVIPDSIPSPEKVVAVQLENEQVRSLLDGLPAQDRAAIILRYWYDVPDEEIGHMLGMTVSAVKSRLFRTRKALAKSWLDSGHPLPFPEKEEHGTPAL